MKFNGRWVAVTPMLILLAGCGNSGYYYDRNAEYDDAKVVDPLTLPETRNTLNYQDAMPVPPANNGFIKQDGSFEPPRPQALGSGSEEQPFVETRESGAQRWLIVNAAPASVWPRLQEFVTQNGYTVQSIDGDNGQISTDAGMLAVRQGLRNNTSEVYCLQGNQVASECLQSLQQYLASSAPEGGVSLVAQRLSRNDRIHLQSQHGNWRLAIELDFQRAWSELAYQLERNFNNDDRKLVDQNQSERVFRVNYKAKDSGSGWWIFGSDGEAKPYQLVVTPAGDSVFVTVTDDQGNAVDQKTSRELLDAVATTLR
ncbi:outer membrane protein assembly factor BamC [Phytohalomonas tamaricis]|uniref:outer membrane protein assembly factor BamC n=1 Tax=Phytohalomonas tamaricis TaxID=2081032 RepID=UPI000D0B0B86|nr:outer membrane protein assembly factor BamC [Phytohalomonas tamaricis]